MTVVLHGDLSCSRSIRGLISRALVFLPSLPSHPSPSFLRTAVMNAAQCIASDPEAVIVAGGMESMSNAPYYLERARTGYRLGVSSSEFEFDVTIRAYPA